MPHLFASPLRFLCLLLSSVVLVPCMFQSHHSSLVKCVLTSKQATHSPVFETEFIWRDSIMQRMKHRLWSQEERVSFSDSRPSLAGYEMQGSQLPSLILLSVSCREKWRCSTSKLTHRVVGGFSSSMLVGLLASVPCHMGFLQGTLLLVMQQARRARERE